jgi:hypothetical protein
MDIEDPNKSMPKRKYTRHTRPGDCTKDELLDLLKKYYEEYGKVPTEASFRMNSDYPCEVTYQKHFGSWSNALRLVGMDLDSVVKEGITTNNQHKARLGELLVFNSFKEKNKAVDLSGRNCKSIFDGICPKGKSYDVKIASFRKGGYQYYFGNKEFDKIEYFYMVAVNKEYTELHCIWLIPRKDLKFRSLYISLSGIHKYNKYLVDFSKCNLDFLNNTNKKEE